MKTVQPKVHLSAQSDNENYKMIIHDTSFDNFSKALSCDGLRSLTDVTLSSSEDLSFGPEIHLPRMLTSAPSAVLAHSPYLPLHPERRDGAW